MALADAGGDQDVQAAGKAPTPRAPERGRLEEPLYRGLAQAGRGTIPVRCRSWVVSSMETIAMPSAASSPVREMDPP